MILHGDLLHIHFGGHEGLPMSHIDLLLILDLLLLARVVFQLVVDLRRYSGILVVSEVILENMIKILVGGVCILSRAMTSESVPLRFVLTGGEFLHNFILQFAGTAVGLFPSHIHQLLIMVKLLAMLLDLIVVLQLKNATMEEVEETQAELNSDELIIPEVEVAAFPLGPTKGQFICIAVVDACPPETDPGSALLGLRSAKVTTKVAEVLHLFREDVWQFLGDIGVFLTDATVHETRFLLGVAVDIDV